MLSISLQDFHDDVETHKEIVDRLDRTGTYLKYYGAKHDAIVIRNQLLSIKLRWKRLLWKTEERGRLLNSAYKEDKRVCSVTANANLVITKAKAIEQFLCKQMVTSEISF